MPVVCVCFAQGNLAEGRKGTEWAASGQNCIVFDVWRIVMQAWQQAHNHALQPQERESQKQSCRSVHCVVRACLLHVSTGKLNDVMSRTAAPSAATTAKHHHLSAADDAMLNTCFWHVQHMHAGHATGSFPAATRPPTLPHLVRLNPADGETGTMPLLSSVLSSAPSSLEGALAVLR
jgi:hypothetical protein